MMSDPLYRLRRAASFAVVMMAVAIAASGCLFEAREADPPPVAGGGDVIIFDDPQDVFTGLRVGLEDDNFSNYDRAIGDDFIFSPLLDDSLDQTFNATTFANWNRDVELEVARLILSESDTIDVEFNPAAVIDQNTFVRFETSYSISVSPRVDGPPSVYQGIANVDVRKIGGIWQVVFWDEVEPDDKLPSWGFLRGVNRGDF